MSQIEIITTPDGEERRLGCLTPASFPTAARTYAGGPDQVLTLDQVRAELRNRPGLVAHDFRKRFAGNKYIRNQRDKGSCNGWSTAGGLSRLRELRGEPYMCLSGSDAYSQMNGGQDNGSVLSDGLKIVEANGIAPESLVPWDRIYTNQISAEAKAARARFKGFGAYAIDSEEELATALLLGRMVVVAVHATNSFNSEDSNGINQGGNGVGNHSVLTQDVKLHTDGTLLYDMANSWDVSWCDGGYTWLTFSRHLRQTIGNHRFWALMSTTDDQADGSTPPAVKG